MSYDSGQLSVSVRVRAGKMNVIEKKVKPDSRQGAIVIGHDGDGSLHFQWRGMGNDGQEDVIDDYLLIPEQCYWDNTRCPPRVYRLKFTEDNTVSYWYWMQDIDPSTDAANAIAINEALKTSPHGDDEPTKRPRTVEDVQQQLFTSPPAAGTSQDAQEQQSGANLYQMWARMQQKNLNLADILTDANVGQVIDSLSDDEWCQLKSLLPEMDANKWRAKQVLRSPQFHSFCSSISYVCNRGMSGMLLEQFGVRCNPGIGVENMLKSIQDAVDKDKSNGHHPSTEIKQ